MCECDHWTVPADVIVQMDVESSGVTVLCARCETELERFNRFHVSGIRLLVSDTWKLEDGPQEPVLVAYHDIAARRNVVNIKVGEPIP